MKAFNLRSNRKTSKSFSDARFAGLMRLILLILSLLVFILLDLILYQHSTMPGRGLRYLFVPLLVIMLLYPAAVRYVQSAYGLKKFGSAFQSLVAAIFSLRYPTLSVAEGKIQTKSETDNLLATVGGPGFLGIQPGNVVLLESLEGNLRVLGAGRHYISRLETVKEVLSLEERYAQVEKIAATTKDGIEVIARDIRYRYRLWSGANHTGGLKNTPEASYHFSEEAVINSTYNRIMDETGLTSWHSSVNQVVEGVISDYICQHQIDHLTAPDSEGDDPRGKICEKFYSHSVKDRFWERGAELLWIDIGHFDIPEKQVAEQRVSAWQAKWAGSADIVRAFGEAQRLAYQEMGQAEAQAEILKSIARALEEVGRREDSREQMRKIYLARIAQFLDTMSKGHLSSGKSPSPPLDNK